MGRLQLVQGDLVQAQVDAIVNAANTDLARGGGVCGAIHRGAGPRLEEECRRVAPCPEGSARITPGYDLPAKYVIHAVGPHYHDGTRGEPEALASAYRESLRLAAEHGLRSIAFPAISTGIYGYPTQEAAMVALRAIREWIDTNELPELIRMVLYAPADLGVWQAAAATGEDPG